jgi:hypothetical protein
MLPLYTVLLLLLLPVLRCVQRLVPLLLPSRQMSHKKRMSNAL